MLQISQPSGYEKLCLQEFVYISITNSNAVVPSRSLIQRLSLKAESFEKSSGMDRLVLVLLLPSSLVLAEGR